MRIYLVGFMGCGKTRLGRHLAPAMDIQQIDLDHFIEESKFLTVPQIFEKYGEEGFRKIESEKLKEISSFENVLISTGGGAPCFFDNMDVMNASGVTVFLNVKPKKLAKRLLNSKNERPLIKGMEKEELINFIKMKLKDRKPFYKKAHLSLDPSDYELEELIEIIKNKHSEIFDKIKSR